MAEFSRSQQVVLKTNSRTRTLLFNPGKISAEQISIDDLVSQIDDDVANWL